MNLDDLAQEAATSGNRVVVLGRIEDLAGLLAEAILLVDQGHERLVIDLRIVDRDTTRRGPTRPPGTHAQIGAEEGQQGPGRMPGRSGRYSSGSGRVPRAARQVGLVLLD